MQKRCHRRVAGQRLDNELPEPISRSCRSARPPAFMGDSIFSPPLLAGILMKPRTVSACHSLAAMIFANVAPLARFIIAITSALLPARSGAAFFAGLDFI